ncbi:MAG: sigma-70 family RNA polymerase sigma factor [Armatimonadota bacterium]
MPFKFNALWESHRTTLKRLLIAWSRDLDLADDLLQETYLRAHAGFAGYRGGDGRAWLAAIARNVFYTHLRRCRDVPYAELPEEGTQDDAADRVDRLAIRQAVEGLPPDLKAAILLRHYGDLTYQQIAECCGCPEGTARRRVWTAVRRLRAALGVTGKERERMGCRNVSGITLLEYLYGILPEEHRKAVEAHLSNCPACREEAEALRWLQQNLYKVEGDFSIFYLTELAPDGNATYYVWSRFTNRKDKPQEEFWMLNLPGMATEFLALQGEEVALACQPWERDPSRLEYRARLPRPVSPGESFDGMAISRPTGNAHRPVKVNADRWRFTTQLGLGAQRDAAIILLANRLPEGATLLATDPPADEVRAAQATTVIWRLLPPPQQATDYTVEYTL